MSLLREVSFFKKIGRSTFPDKNVSLKYIVNLMKFGSEGVKSTINKARLYVNEDGYKQPSYSLIKKQLPSFTVSGTFEVRNKKSSVNKYTYLTILDIDGVVKQGKNMNELRSKIAVIPETYISFISPSADGFKIVIQIDSEPEHHGWATKLLMQYYGRILEVEIDSSGKDISRLCFLTFDPFILVNEESKVFNVSLDLPMDTRIRKAIKLTEKRISFVEGSRNSFIYYLCCNLNRYGVVKDSTMDVLCSRYVQHDFTENEIEKTVNGAYLNVGEFGKWSKYYARPKFIGDEGLSKKELRELEGELYLHNIDCDEKNVSRLLVELLDERCNESLYTLLRENFTDYSDCISADTYGDIIRYIAENEEMDSVTLIGEGCKTMTGAIEELSSKDYEFKDLSRLAKRVIILRFKIDKIKFKFRKISRVIIFKSINETSSLQKELDLLSNLHNELTLQVKTLFNSYKEKEL